jgi:hypothetical protein
MKQSNPLTAQIYVDSDTPNMSLSAAEHGIGIVAESVPWIDIMADIGQIVLSEHNFIVADDIRWPKLDADINIVLTKKHILGNEQIRHDGHPNLRMLKNNALHYIGWNYNAERASGNRVALVNTTAIQRPEYIVAHEFGHLLGVEPEPYRPHCIEMYCVMNAFLPEWGRKDREFCEGEKILLNRNAEKLTMYKMGELAIAPNAKIFQKSM